VQLARPAARAASRSRLRWIGPALAVFVLNTLACAPGIKRDLSQVPAGQVGFDDLCGLQSYFDVLMVKTEPPPMLVSGVDFEAARSGKAGRGGRGRFSFQTDFQLRTLRRVLSENWKRLPEELDGASRIDIEVRWAEKAGVRRVVTEEDAEIGVARSSWRLPYHVCLSELLYGEQLYRRRREALGLPPLDPPPAPAPAVAAAHDAGAPTGAGADAGTPPHAAIAAAAVRPDGAARD